MIRYLAAALSLVAAGYAIAYFTAAQENHERLNAVLWSQTAAEYAISTQQVYAAASAQLEEALRTSDWSAAVEQEEMDPLPDRPAIIIDIDETVLDNSPFQAWLVAQGRSFSAQVWREWAELGQAEAVPGALAFLQRVDAAEVHIFYVTNRRDSLEAATRDNLKRLGFPLDGEGDHVLTRGENGWTGDKSARRRHVAENYRLLMLLGDDLNDFVSARIPDPESRRVLGRQFAERFGRQWFLLPNPMTGTWEAALFERDGEKLNREQAASRILSRKYEQLRPFRE